MDLIRNSTSDVEMIGDAQIRRSQEASENGASSGPTNDARRNIILFANDRCTINFNMEFNVSELEGEVASFFEQNIQANGSLLLNSIPTADQPNSIRALNHDSANADHSSDIMMPLKT